MDKTPEYDDIMAMLNGTYDLNANYKPGTNPKDIAEGPETWIPSMVQDYINAADKVLYPENPSNLPPNLAAVPIVPGLRNLTYVGPTRDFYGKELKTGYKYPTTPSGFINYNEENDYNRQPDDDENDYQIPTSSKNPQRPRTVAAAYNAFNQTLTVVFLDSTFYNYYKVNENEWNSFKESYSKGEYIASVLDSKPRGIADVSSFPAEHRVEAYEAARSAQLRYHSTTGFLPKPTKPRATRRTSGKPTTEINFGKPGKLIF
jgi:hypothetical protein